MSLFEWWLMILVRTSVRYRAGRRCGRGAQSAYDGTHRSSDMTRTENREAFLFKWRQCGARLFLITSGARRRHRVFLRGTEIGIGPAVVRCRCGLLGPAAPPNSRTSWTGLRSNAGGRTSGPPHFLARKRRLLKQGLRLSKPL
jgi:hypothetical protein